MPKQPISQRLRVCLNLTLKFLQVISEGFASCRKGSVASHMTDSKGAKHPKERSPYTLQDSHTAYFGSMPQYHSLHSPLCASFNSGI